jgi:hypothetical protein
MSKFLDMAVRLEMAKDRMEKGAQDYGRRVSRAGSHVAVHFLQGAEFGARIGGTAGLLVGGLLSLSSGTGYLATLASKVGAVAFGALGSVGGAVAMTLTARKQVLSELRGHPVPITGIKTSGYSLPEFLKLLLGNLLEKEGAKGESSPEEKAENGTPPAQTEFKAAANPHIGAITPDERFALTEMMLPDYVRLLEIKKRTGNAVLYDPQKFQIDLLHPGLTGHVNAMFDENPELVARATLSSRGIQALTHAENIQELDLLLNLSWGAWGKAALPGYGIGSEGSAVLPTKPKAELRA